MRVLPQAAVHADKGRRQHPIACADDNEPTPMRYLALACDYDGTLAAEGRVPPETVGALERLRAQNLVLFLQLSDGVDDVTGFTIGARGITRDGSTPTYRPFFR